MIKYLSSAICAALIISSAEVIAQSPQQAGGMMTSHTIDRPGILAQRLLEPSEDSSSSSNSDSDESGFWLILGGSLLALAAIGAGTAILTSGGSQQLVSFGSYDSDQPLSTPLRVELAADYRGRSAQDLLIVSRIRVADW